MWPVAPVIRTGLCVILKSSAKVCEECYELEVEAVDECSELRICLMILVFVEQIVLPFIFKFFIQTSLVTSLLTPLEV